MGDEENVSIRFVLPPGKNETTCSEDLAFAFDQTQDAGLHPVWIHHDEVLDLSYSKMDVFVMDPFDGKAFAAVSQSKATIVGPRCLLSCLQKKEPVPELPYPMFTAAMKGLIITSTGFDKEKKSQIQKLVERMSGIYSNAFHDGVTHLVAAVVRSSKYSVAVDKEIPIMTEEWVLQVWNKSQCDNVAAVDRQFARYACPALMGLTITVSQMTSKDKELLKKSIESHGGIYSKSLDMHSTSVLIIPTPEGEKFTYARKWKIPTLNSNWVFDSIEKGYCLETDSYKVEKRSCSTPSKDNVSRLAEVSLCSTIMAPGGDETTTVKINETIDGSSSSSVIGKNGNRGTDTWLHSLDLNRVTKAGPFLDGCRIYLSGFDDAQQEHLRRVFLSAGATRMSQLTPSVTHMIVKSFAKTKHLKELNLNPHQVTIQWVVESMRLGRIAPESDFVPPKIHTSLPPIFPKEDRTNEEQVTQLDNDILAQYSKKQTDADVARTKPNENTGSQAMVDEEDYSQLTKFLTGKRLALVGIDEDTEQELCEWIDEEGGETVSADFKGLLDYLVLPVHGCDLHTFKARSIVNHLWLAECFDKGGFVDIEYFFKSYPIDLKVKPLEGVVIGISGFASQERQFLCSLTEALGGISQETFAKREKGDTKKSTHLVCLSPDGNKYDAAIRWKLPVVSKDWIMACTAKMTWVSEKSFLLGDSNVFSPNKPLPNEVPDVLQDGDLNETKVGEEDNFCTPANSKTLKSSGVALETPGLDIEKLKPKRIELSPSIGTKWNPPPDSQPTPSVSQKRKRQPSNDQSDELHLSKLDTPDRPFGAFLGKDDPSPHTRKFWKHQFDKVVSSRPSEGERKKLMEEIVELDSYREKRVEERKPHSSRMSIAGMNDPQKTRSDSQAALDTLQARGIPVLERAGRSFDDLMEEKMNRVGKSWKHVGKRVKLIRDDDLNDSNTIYKLPLEGIKIYVTKKCLSHIDRISEAVHQLGGSVLGTYDEENVTHVIFSSNRANDITKEFRQARNDGKHIVCPDWVFDCLEEKKLLDPSKYPHTLNSKNYTACSSNEPLDSTLVQPTKRLKRGECGEEKSRDLSQDIAKMNEIITKAGSDGKDIKTNSSVKKIKMTLSSTECTPGRSSLEDGCSSKDSSDLDSQALGSQIQWIDPKESKEQMKLAKKLSICESTVNNSEFQSMNVLENMTENEETESSVSIYRFMISGYPDDVKITFGKLIDSMQNSRISFSNLNGCDPEATHIIAPKFPRSEKMLCSIASGKMFLHSSYFDDCMARKEIITPVDKYEWGHPDNPFLSKLEDNGFEKQLATASYKWRLKIWKKRNGAFDGIIAIIHTTPKRREAFQRLIEFGGGRVITPNPPYSNSEDATHCFAEPLKVPKSKIDYEALASKGIAVVEPIFINEFLINDPPPPVENYLISDFKPIWEKRH